MQTMILRAESRRARDFRATPLRGSAVPRFKPRGRRPRAASRLHAPGSMRIGPAVSCTLRHLRRVKTPADLIRAYAAFLVHVVRVAVCS